MDAGGSATKLLRPPADEQFEDDKIPLKAAGIKYQAKPKSFPNAAGVNDSLRALADIMRRQHKALPASKPVGQLMVAGARGDEPISVALVPLLFGMRSLAGTITGSSIDAENALSFSSLHQIRPMIETVPLANAAEAYGRMMRNEARFRMALVTTGQ